MSRARAKSPIPVSPVFDVLRRAAPVFARVSLAAAFLSAVASRLGFWQGHLDPARFEAFVQHTGEVNAFMPRATIPALAYLATAAEIVLGVLLLVGYRVRATALASVLLLAAFGTAMAMSSGIKEPLDYSVFSAAAAALLLATRAGEGAEP